LENQKTNEKKELRESGMVEKKITSEHFEELLKYRQRKCEKIEKLHYDFDAPVITIRANYPGSEKINDTTSLILSEVSKQFEESFRKKILLSKLCNTPEGPTMFYVVKGDSRTLKENAIFIEMNHELGRFVDIDVYDKEEDYAVTRIELSHEPRKCFLCEEHASTCSQLKTHSTEDLITFMEKQIGEYLKKK